MSEMRVYPCLIDRVIDGDTLLVAIDHGFEIYSKQIVRVYGVNAPEMDTEEGKEVKMLVDRWLGPQGEVLELHSSSKKDKYGRRLADVFRKGKSLSEWMLAKDFAVEYLP